MKKSTYIFICLLLSLGFWDLNILHSLLTNDFILILTCVWALFAFPLFHENQRLKAIFSMKYTLYMNAIFIGVLISMFSALFFWGQNLLTTFLAQRYIYSFILLPAILYVQPTITDIIKTLKWVSILSITIWIITITYPHFIWKDEEYYELRQASENSDIGIVTGEYFIIFYLYFKIEEYVNKFSWNSFFVSIILLGIILLFQNRSLIIGVIPVFAYSLIKFRSTHKLLILSSIAIIVLTFIFFSIDIWTSLIYETQGDISNLEYNRWKALIYFMNDYSPNWFCYIFGNGFPSALTSFGQLMWKNFDNGIYASDLGMIGMWTDYGLIPLLSIYYVIFKILNGKIFPLYLKFICFHILLVPTIFQFWSNPGIFLFVLIIYLFAYHSEHYKLLI